MRCKPVNEALDYLRIVATGSNCSNLVSRALGITNMPVAIRLRSIWLPEVCHTGVASLTFTKVCTRVVAFCLNGLFALEPAGVAKQKMRAPNLTLPGVALGAWQYVDVKVQWVLCGRSSPRLVGTPGLCGRRAPLCQADGRGCQITVQIEFSVSGPA